MRKLPTHLTLTLLTAASAAGTLAGCTKVQALPREAAPRAVTTRPTVLSAGDVIEFKFYSAPELDDQQTIRPDGVISLQLVGEVVAAGRQPGELQEELESRYSAHLKDPTITVILRQSLERRVFIGGEVRQPGAIGLPAGLDVFQAITLAGGHLPVTSAMGHVIVMRMVEGQRVGYRVDLRPVLRGEATEPFALAPGDHVYVPRAAIANVNTFVEQYVGGVIPNGIQATRTLGNTTYGIDSTLD